MAKNFPLDEFDSVERSGGAHRAAKTARARLVSLVKYLAAVAVLSGAGIGSLILINGGVQQDSGAGVAATQVTPNVETFKGDGVGVMVIDSTSQKGFASKVAHKLLDAGWNVYGAANSGADTLVSTTGKTVVYVNADSAKAEATTLLATLGTYEIKVSTALQDPITVILGKDYK